MSELFDDFNQNQAPRSTADMEEPMSIKEWLFTLLINMIPCVNIVMLFVWGFGSNVKRSKANFCKAMLIMTAIIVGIYLLLMLIGIAGAISFGTRYS